jgi:hypothetical protein
VAAIFTLAQAAGPQGLGPDVNPVLVKLAADPSVAAWSIRAVADHVPAAAVATTAAAARPAVVAGLASKDARTRREAARAVARLDLKTDAAAVVPLLDDPDPIVAHTAQQALQVSRRRGCLLRRAIDDPAAPAARRAAALRVLGTLHDAAAVDGLDLPSEGRACRRPGGAARAAHGPSAVSTSSRARNGPVASGAPAPIPAARCISPRSGASRKRLLLC